MTPKEASKRIKQIGDRMRKVSRESEFAAMFTLMGAVKGRIHNQGKDSKGASLGGYSKSYARKRTKAGKKNNYKSLQFNDDLFKAYGTGVTDKGNPAFGFTTQMRTFPEPKRPDSKPRNDIPYGEFAALIESNEGRTIFTPSDRELDKMARAYLKDLGKRIAKI